MPTLCVYSSQSVRCHCVKQTCIKLKKKYRQIIIQKCLVRDSGSQLVIQMTEEKAAYNKGEIYDPYWTVHTHFRYPMLYFPCNKCTSLSKVLLFILCIYCCAMGHFRTILNYNLKSIVIDLRVFQELLKRLFILQIMVQRRIDPDILWSLQDKVPGIRNRNYSKRFGIQQSNLYQGKLGINYPRASQG